MLEGEVNHKALPGGAAELITRDLKIELLVDRNFATGLYLIEVKQIHWREGAVPDSGIVAAAVTAAVIRAFGGAVKAGLTIRWNDKLLYEMRGVAKPDDRPVV